MNGSDHTFKVGDVVSIHYRGTDHDYYSSILKFFLENDKRRGFVVGAVHQTNYLPPMYSLKDQSGLFVRSENGNLIAFYPDELSLDKETTFSDDEWE